MRAAFAEIPRDKGSWRTKNPARMANVGRDYFAVAVIPREKLADRPTGARQTSHEAAVVVNQLQRAVANYVIARRQDELVFGMNVKAMEISQRIARV